MSNMKINATVYGVLLAGLMAASWVKWTAEPEVELDGKVVLLQGEEAGLEQIVYLAKDKDKAVIERRHDDYGDYLWVTTTRWTPKKPEEATPLDPEKATGDEDEVAEGDAGSEAEPEAEAPPVEYEEDVQVFKAGDAGDKLLASLSPMLAIRRLEAVDASKLETIGLDDPQDSLEITRKGRTVTLELGGEAYGSRDRYVREKATGDIYLVDDEVLRPLKYARTRLPDRTLWDVELPDITQVVVTDAQGTSATFLHKNPDDETKAWWMREGGPEEQDTQLDTWMDKALKLRGTKYADPADPPQDLVERFTLTLDTTAGRSLTLRVQQEGDKGDFWASTPWTRGHVKLLKTATDALSDDVSTIVE